jgi:predicted dehydrogenase
LTAEPAYPGLRSLIERFYSAISADSEPPIRRQEALEIAAVCDALRKASEAASPSTPPL